MLDTEETAILEAAGKAQSGKLLTDDEMELLRVAQVPFNDAAAAAEDDDEDGEEAPRLPPGRKPRSNSNKPKSKKSVSVGFSEEASTIIGGGDEEDEEDSGLPEPRYPPGRGPPAAGRKKGGRPSTPLPMRLSDDDDDDDDEDDGDGDGDGGDLSGAFEGLAEAMGGTLERSADREHLLSQIVGASELDDMSKSVGRCNCDLKSVDPDNLRGACFQKVKTRN